MLQIKTGHLDEDCTEMLAQLQNNVNSQGNFAKRVGKAKALWRTRGGEKGKIKFAEIREQLRGLCVSTAACNYCEGNEANDIEHIFPKSFFPELTFVWENYLLSCKQCNTGEKLDVCYVFDAEDNLLKLERNEEPAFTEVAFINQRTENPLRYIWLNLESGEFETKVEELTPKEVNKAQATLDVLQLNYRDYLVEGRKVARSNYFNIMDRLRRILECDTKEAIAACIDPYQGELDWEPPIEEIKAQRTLFTRKLIKKMLYPSVWQSIKDIDSKVDPKWVSIFSVIEDAKNW